MDSTSAPATPRSGHLNPWLWVPSLYFAQGIPYVMAMTVSVIMYKRLGISNGDIALYTSWLYLPWVIKPLWSPVVDLFGTKRQWVIVLQFVIAVVLASVALTVPAASFFRYTLALFWLMAFSSATHDIAADGFYMLGLEQHQQAAFSGVRSTFYRIAMITGEGALVMLAGQIELLSKGNLRLTWELALLAVALLFAAAFIYHAFILPRPAADVRAVHGASTGLSREFFLVFAEFFRKPQIVLIVAFLLLYRMNEAQLVKMVYPFLLDPRTAGGLGLTTSQAGFVKGTVGVTALLCGGILGGIAISRRGLKYWLWPMVLIIHFPDLAFLFLAWVQPASKAVIAAAIGLEQFGYGFGFTAYMLFMIMVAEGQRKTAHYAICTGFMALSMMIPGMWSGWVQEQLGYRWFYVWVSLSILPGLLVASMVKVDPAFGCRKEAADPPRCRTCGGLLKGNETGACPECGTRLDGPTLATVADEDSQGTRG